MNAKKRQGREGLSGTIGSRQRMCRHETGLLPGIASIASQFFVWKRTGAARSDRDADLTQFLRGTSALIAFQIESLYAARDPWTTSESLSAVPALSQIGNIRSSLDDLSSGR
ncbi:hypothetical protein [Paraburkholderia xenovorans]|uniref:hypothetical protein n=1 Tax=Paraburkholderia xenovorans TaxID=36873 RepID=UPI0038BDC334